MDPMNQHLAQAQIAATLAASIVTAMGRPVSMAEVENIVRDVTMTMFPQTGSGAFKMWKEKHDPNKVYE